MTTSYRPSDFQAPVHGTHYIDTLGKAEWEIIATHIIKESQRAGKWVPLKDYRHLNVEDYDLKEMVDVGKLVETVNGYMLTDDCLDQIAKKYAPQK